MVTTRKIQPRGNPGDCRADTIKTATHGTLSDLGEAKAGAGCESSSGHLVARQTVSTSRSMARRWRVRLLLPLGCFRSQKKLQVEEQPPGLRVASTSNLAVN